MTIPKQTLGAAFVSAALPTAGCAGVKPNNSGKIFSIENDGPDYPGIREISEATPESRQDLGDAGPGPRLRASAMRLAAGQFASGD